jgi:hypothetical protein
MPRRCFAQQLSSDAPVNLYPAGEMPDKRQQAEKTPKGFDVPIPKRSEFFVNLKKVAKIGKRSTPARGPEKK